MKVKRVNENYVAFEEIGIGEVFEADEKYYLKINNNWAFDVFNNKLEVVCKGWDTLIPRKSELTVY